MNGVIVLVEEDVDRDYWLSVVEELKPAFRGPRWLSSLVRLGERVIHPFVHSWVDCWYVYQTGARPIQWPRICWVCFAQGRLVSE